VAEGGDGDDHQRPSVSSVGWRRVADPAFTWERAGAEAARRIAGDLVAKNARKALIAANPDVPDYEMDLDEACAFALYFYWRISARVETENNATVPAERVEQDARGAMEWISVLAADMPSLFKSPDEPLGCVDTYRIHKMMAASVTTAR
jgi:hypothetical protein